MEEIAGMLGIKRVPWEFGRYTLRQLINAYKGLLKRDSWAWERARMVCYFVTVPNVKKGRRLKPQDLFSLDSDKNLETDQSNKHETYKLMEKWDKK